MTNSSNTNSVVGLQTQIGNGALLEGSNVYNLRRGTIIGSNDKITGTMSDATTYGDNIDMENCYTANTGG